MWFQEYSQEHYTYALYLSYQLDLPISCSVIGYMVSERYRASASNASDEDLSNSDSEEEEEHGSISVSQNNHDKIVFGNFRQEAPAIHIKSIKPATNGSSVKIGEIICFITAGSAATPKLCQWSFPSTAMATASKNVDEDSFSKTEEEEVVPDPPLSWNSAVTLHLQMYEETTAKSLQILSSSVVIVETAKKLEVITDLYSFGSGDYEIEVDLDEICFAPANRGFVSIAIADYITTFNPGGTLNAISNSEMPPQHVVPVFDPGGNHRYPPLFSLLRSGIEHVGFSSSDVWIVIFNPGGTMPTISPSAASQHCVFDPSGYRRLSLLSSTAINRSTSSFVLLSSSASINVVLNVFFAVKTLSSTMDFSSVFSFSTIF